MKIFKKIRNSRLEIQESLTEETTAQAVTTWSDVTFVHTFTPEVIPAKWIFVFFDLPSEDTTRRIALLRRFKFNIGLALHTQSVYFMPYSPQSYRIVNGIDDGLTVIRADIENDKAIVLVGLYQNLIEALFLEIEEKVEKLAEAKADSDNTRGYTKRYNKMWERFGHLKFVLKYVPADSHTQRIELLESMVEEINNRSQGVGIS